MITPYLSNSVNYSYPYKPIAMFYHYTIAVPYQSVDKVWYWLVSLELASAENTSFVIACVGIAIYTYILIVLYGMWINIVAKVLRRSATDRPSRAFAWLIFILPALFTFVWYIVPIAWHFIMDLINHLQAE